MAKHRTSCWRKPPRNSSKRQRDKSFARASHGDGTLGSPSTIKAGIYGRKRFASGSHRRRRSQANVSNAEPDPGSPARIIVRAVGQTFTADLTNLLNRIRGYPDEDPGKLIAEFIASIDDLTNRYAREDNLVAVLRDGAYVDQINKMKRGALTEPFVGELAIVYMAD